MMQSIDLTVLVIIDTWVSVNFGVYLTPTPSG